MGLGEDVLSYKRHQNNHIYGFPTSKTPTAHTSNCFRPCRGCDQKSWSHLWSPNKQKDRMSNTCNTSFTLSCSDPLSTGKWFRPTSTPLSPFSSLILPVFHRKRQICRQKSTAQAWTSSWEHEQRAREWVDGTSLSVRSFTTLTQDAGLRNGSKHICGCMEVCAYIEQENIIHLGHYCNICFQFTKTTRRKHWKSWTTHTWGGGKNRLPWLHVFSCIIGGCDLCEVNWTKMSLVWAQLCTASYEHDLYRPN